MDKQKNKNSEENSIAIKLLDIFPSINEINKEKDEIDIIFQGLDIFHNLFQLLTTKMEITLKINNKSSIIISLIKSNNLFATCVFNIKQGEQWITFSYENKKKKESSLAQSLIDCIKIKLNCDIIQNKNTTNNNISSNSKKTKNYLANNNRLNYNSILTEDNNIKSQSFIDPNKHKSIGEGKILTNKGNKKINIEYSPKEKILEKSKFTWIINNNSNINNSLTNNNKNKNSENIINKKKFIIDDNNNKHEEKGLRRMKTKNSYSRIVEDDLAIRLNKMIHKKDDNKLNLTQRSRKNHNSNGNLDYSLKGNKYYNNNLLFNNFGTNKSQKSKQMLKNRLLYNINKKTEIKNITNEYNNNKKNETEISITDSNKNRNTNINNNINTNNNDLNISKRRKYNNKNERSNDYIDNLNVGASRGSMTNRRNKDIIKDLKNNTSTNAKTPEISRRMKSNNYQNTIDSEIYNFNDDKNKNKLDKDNKDNKDNSFYKNNFSDLDYDNEENYKNLEDLSNHSNNDNNNFYKLKEDFILLYNDNYVRNVQEDLLKLEIELFVEKMTGLISAYHYEINDRKLENKLIENNLKVNSEKYLTFCKLYCRLNIIKKHYKKKYLSLIKNKSNIKEINDKNFGTNKNELELFKLIFPNKENENKKNRMNKEDSKMELKNILNILLSKIKNKKIMMKNDLYKKWCEINKNELNEISIIKDLNEIKNEEIKYRKPKARTRVIPKLQQTQFNSKTNNLNNEQNKNTFVFNENKSEKKIFNNKRIENDNYNFFTHNPNTDIYSKSSAVYSLYPKKFYSRKIPK